MSTTYGSLENTGAMPGPGDEVDFFAGQATMTITQISRASSLDDSFDWDELVSALDGVLSHTGRCFLLFIDGLDEFEDDAQELADMVMRFSKNPNVKICAASRPLVEFKSAFYDMPQLKMQKLTYPDIATYIDGRFADSREFQDLHKYQPEKIY